MKEAVIGPNCIEVCNADCCSIKIDVPKILAQEYIKQGYATKNDFIRGNIFSFQLRFDDTKGKCFLFDKKINGCSVHNSGIKPPQCWIYPTKFSNPENKDISCKKAAGWKVNDLDKAKKAEKLLQYYIFLCQLEAKKEVKAILARINSEQCETNLKCLLKQTSPSQLAGIKDTWDCISILYAQGISLQLKKICQKVKHDCKYIISRNFLECHSICEKVSNKLVDFLQQTLFNYVKNNIDTEGEYPFIKLFEFNKQI
jgi:Fe-S-cluster containining protein